MCNQNNYPLTLVKEYVFDKRNTITRFFLENSLEL